MTVPARPLAHPLAVVPPAPLAVVAPAPLALAGGPMPRPSDLLADAFSGPKRTPRWLRCVLEGRTPFELGVVYRERVTARYGDPFLPRWWLCLDGWAMLTWDRPGAARVVVPSRPSRWVYTDVALEVVLEAWGVEAASVDAVWRAWATRLGEEEGEPYPGRVPVRGLAEAYTRFRDGREAPVARRAAYHPYTGRGRAQHGHACPLGWGSRAGAR